MDDVFLTLSLTAAAAGLLLLGGIAVRAVLMRQRYRAGASSLVDLLDTQRAEFLAQQDVVSGQAQLLKDFVSLQKSLGLGWRSTAS